MQFTNAEAEHNIIGAILIDPDRALPKVTDIVTPQDFSDAKYARMYQGFLALYGDHKKIDVLTLAEWLKRKNLLDAVGGPAALTEITNDILSNSHVVEHARIVADLAARRKLLATTEAINQAAETEDNVDSLLQKAEAAIFAVAHKRSDDDSISLADVLGQTLDRIEATQTGDIPRGVSTGYREVDHILTGLQKSDLIILAARPAMGKTAYALNLARSVGVVQNVPTLIFSLEMSRDQLVDRLLAMETGLPTERLRYGKLEQAELELVTDTMAMLSEAPIYIDDAPNMTIQKLRNRARREHHRHPLGLIIVDYLQLMSGLGRKSDANREQEIAEISRGLKIIARELHVPVVALSQLSRLVESRNPQIPQLSDLRESGSIEQNADIVAFLYRDDYYNMDSSRKNMTDLLIRKHRNGRIGSVELYFDRRTQRFRGVTTS
jgi:replicative DNA helicase